MKYFIFFIVALIAFISCHFELKDKKPGSLKETIKYEVVPGWGVLPDEIKLGKVTGVDVDSRDRVFIFHRGSKTRQSKDSLMEEHPLLILDNHTGNLIHSWGSNRFIAPHGLTIDSNDNIWLTDIALHQVFKFDRNGKLLLVLGEALVPGSGPNHFNGPTDVTVLENGTFFIADGYGNNRVLKFSPSGQLLSIWGGEKRGNKPGQFNLPHSIDSDEKDRIYISDLINKRIQIFNQDGEFLYQWKNKEWGIPYAVKIFTDKRFIVDGGSPGQRGLPLANRSGIYQIDKYGNVKDSFGKLGHLDGEFLIAHDMAQDSHGALYVAEINGRRVQKFIARKILK